LQHRGMSAGGCPDDHHDDNALGDLMSPLAQNGRRMDVIVHHHPQVSCCLQRQGDDVDALIREETADTGQSARTVRQSKVQFGADHAEEITRTGGDELLDRAWATGRACLRYKNESRCYAIDTARRTPGLSRA